MATTEPADTRSIAQAALRRARALVTPRLREVIDTLPDEVRTVGGYHLGWLDRDGRPRESDAGKALRPTLVLLSAQATGGATEDAVAAAAAVELVHNFSLLHDDVMDGDTARRHRPTAWAEFGVAQAVLTGDALLALAVRLVAYEDAALANAATRRLSTALCRLMIGQGRDIAFERCRTVSRAECELMAADKTAALIECACALGALSSGSGPDVVERLARFGHDLGVAFQLTDDLLGIWGEPAATGKPVLSDLRNRKKSLPVVAAMESGTAAAERLRRLYDRPEPLAEEELYLAADLVERAGGRDWARDEAAARMERAETHLRAAATDPAAARELLAVARSAVHRDR